MVSKRTLLGAGLLALATATTVMAREQDPGTDFSVWQEKRHVEWLPANAELGYELRVQRPDGSVFTRSFAPGTVPQWTPGVSLKNAPSGLYTWEITPIAPPPLDPARLNPGRKGASPAYRTTSGYFSVEGGEIVPSNAEESFGGKAVAEKATVLANNDGVIRNSLCVGIDCLNAENFGFDTVRLKENNTRFHFDDTSTSGSFPRNDWRIVANDSANGGASYLAIEDATAGRIPFRVVAGAPANSLYVNSSGHLGLKTATPVVELHVSDGDSPTMRLEQNASSGFTPQTWDVAGNEANFFVRDVTNGSKLPLRIRPGAPTSSLDISSSGNIGVGTASPSKKLHIKGDSASGLGQNNTMLQIENSSGTEAPRRLIELINNGSPLFVFKNTADGSVWNMSPVGSTFVISLSGSGNQELELDGNGNMTIAGTLTENSSRSAKRDFVNVDENTILAKLGTISIEEWSYKHTPDARHVGPMAEDFHATFGLGPNDGISPRDLAGIALAATKALKAENERLERDAAEKDARIESLEERLSRVEALLGDSQ